MLRTVRLCFVALLPACTSTPTDLAAASNSDLVAAYIQPPIMGGGSTAVREELRRRDIWSAEDWRLIDEGKVSVGMNGDAALVSWGTPTRKHSFTTARGKTRVVEYGNWGVLFIGPDNRVVEIDRYDSLR